MIYVVPPCYPPSTYFYIRCQGLDGLAMFGTRFLELRQDSILPYVRRAAKAAHLQIRLETTQGFPCILRFHCAAGGETYGKYYYCYYYWYVVVYGIRSKGLCKEF